MHNLIWAIMLIPVLSIIILAVWFSQKMHPIEYAAVLLIPVICILIGKYTSIYSQKHDVEYWNSYATSAVYLEDWNQRVHCRHPKYETRWRLARDSEGNSHMESYRVQVGYDHLYDVDYHPPCWSISDNIGGSYNISQEYFGQLCNIWSNKVFRDLNRDYHTKDGNEYFTTYDNNFDHTVPVCVQHVWENKVQCSKTAFNFKEVTPDIKLQYRLFEIPNEDIFNFNPVLGINNYPATRELQIYNALNGSRKKLHMMLLVFTDQPEKAGLYQESYWKGGNKNEFIVCVGIDKEYNTIKWTRVISWTDVAALKDNTAKDIREMETFDAMKIVKYMGENVPKTFIKKNFHDFDYLSVEPTTKAIVWTLIITLICTIGICVYSAMNEFTNYRGVINHDNRRS